AAGRWSNNAFKPKLHRYAVNMAERACHVASYALQFGLTQALDLMSSMFKHRALWFTGLGSLHLLLYQSALLPASLGGVVLFLTWAPWLPLAWAHLPVTSPTLISPNTLGLTWCAIIWLAAYWFIAGSL